MYINYIDIYKVFVRNMRLEFGEVFIVQDTCGNEMIKWYNVNKMEAHMDIHYRFTGYVEIMI